MKVLITGGGIGGLCTALACLHFGHEVQLFEQAADFEPVGAGIQLSPNAMRVLERLGLSEGLSAQSVSPEAIEARLGEAVFGKTGRQIFHVPLGALQASQRWAAPYLHTHRADLVDVLRAALPDKILHKGARVVSYQQEAKNLSIELASGQKVSGDILVGADGIHSQIRTQMIGEDAPNFTGCVAWRAVVPIKALSHPPPPTACVWMGRGRHGVTYQLRGGRFANFVGVVEDQDWRDESWTGKGTLKAALEDFAGWDPVILDMINAADAESGLYRWALFDRPSLKRWVDGRVVLLGDAAHPMLPFLAQGAAMAIEDSWVLAKSLSQNFENPSKYLQNYAAQRQPRTSRMQKASRKNMHLFHRQSALSQLASYGPMWLAGKLCPRAIQARLDWIYGYDALK